jgi:formamidopyrimidine-DNA glycosylase
MPELPEVEGTRRRLAPLVVGRRVVRLEVRDHKLWHPADGLSEREVEGRAVGGIERRAKLLIFSLGGNLALALHLKIAGQIAYVTAGGTRIVGGHPYPLPGADLPDAATRFALHLEGGDTLFVNDQRRFSWLRLMPAREVGPFVAAQQYGPDPLDATFTPDVLAQRLRARKGRPVKAALLDQTCIAGLGNIYADETLHRARLHPLTRAGDLTTEDVARLHQSIHDVLAVAVPVAGAVVTNGHAVDDAESGRDFLRAHGRAGAPCPNCAVDAPGAPDGEPPRIVRAFLAGRGTYFCPHCQPAPPGFVLPADGTAGSRFTG